MGTAQNSTLALLNGFLVLIALCVIYPTGPRVLKSLLRMPLLLCFAILAPVSSLWSSIGLISLRRAILLDVMIVFSVWFLETYSTEEQETLILSTGVFVALSSLAMALLLPQYGRMDTGEWKGIFYHKNLLAQSMELLFSPLLFRRVKPGFQMVGTVSMAILALSLMALSQARTGMLLTLNIVFVAIFARLVRSTPRFKLVLYYLGAVSFFVGLPAIFIGRSTFLELLGKSANLTGRLDTWPLVIPFIFKHPFLGYGYAGFWNGYTGDSGTAMSGMSGAMNAADNGYIDIGLQFGLVGLFVLLAFLFKALRDFLQISQWTTIPLSAFWYVALVLDALLANVSGTFFFEEYGITTIMLVLGCVGLSRLRRSGQFSSHLQES